MRQKRLLLVEDSAEFRAKVRAALGGLYHLTEAVTEEEFRRVFQPYAFDLVILDLRLRTAREGLDLLREIHFLDDLQPVIMMSAYGDTDSTLDALESGAMLFLHKREFTPELLGRTVEAVLQQGNARRQLRLLSEQARGDFCGSLVGLSAAVRRATQLAREAAGDPDTAAIINGERGTERQQVARLIYESAPGAGERPFVSADARSLAEDDLIPAIFGRGGRAGVPRARGLVEEANGGVFFLDQADTLPPAVTQVLGQGLREKKVGSALAGIQLPVEVQFIAGIRQAGAAPAVKQWIAGQAGRVVEIFLPPLRERREDIPVLASNYLQILRRKGRTPARALSTEAVSLLERHPWLGNVRELSNAIEFAAIQAMIDGAHEIGVEHLPANLSRVQRKADAGSVRDYKLHLARAELEFVARALEELGTTNKAKLALALGYNDRFALFRRVRRCLEEFPVLGSQFPELERTFREKELVAALDGTR